MYRTEKELLEKKDDLGTYDYGLVDTELMPLINIVWQHTFAWRNKKTFAQVDTS